MRTGALVACCVLGLLACAKKMPPPNPDRFPPRVEGITTRTRTQFEIAFDEPVEPAATPLESLTLQAADGGTLVVRGVSRGRGDSRLLVWTEALEPGIYEVRGRAADRAGNSVRFRSRFRAGTRADTVPPRVAAIDPRPGTDRVRYSPRVTVRLSEPADTTAGVSWFFAPAWLDTLFRRAWERDWQSFALGYRDSLPPGLVAYFVVPAGWRDLEGNRARFTAATFFACDSAPALELVAGVVTGGDSLVRGGIVFVESARTVAATAVEPSGRFALRLAPGSYWAQAVADTSGNGLVDLASDRVSFTSPQESLRLDLRPVQQGLPPDAYRR